MDTRQGLLTGSVEPGTTQEKGFPAVAGLGDGRGMTDKQSSTEVQPGCRIGKRAGTPVVQSVSWPCRTCLRPELLRGHTLHGVELALGWVAEGTDTELSPSCLSASSASSPPSSEVTAPPAPQPSHRSAWRSGCCVWTWLSVASGLDFLAVLSVPTHCPPHRPPRTLCSPCPYPACFALGQCVGISRGSQPAHVFTPFNGEAIGFFK